MYHINKESIGNGENITLQNTATHYFKKFDILGNSKQEGIPSINSEAPIESVGDNINLFDKDNANVINGFFHKDNTVIVANTNRKIVYIECMPNQEYVLSTVEDIVANKMAFGYTTAIPAIGVQVYSINASANKELTLKTGSDAKYLVAYIHSENYTMSLEDILNNLKISKRKGAYSPYGQGSIEIYNGNKNFLDFTNYQTFTATNAYYTIKANDFELKSSLKYIFNFSASGDFSTANAIKLWFRDTNNSSFKDVLANTEFSLTEEELNKLSYIQIVVQALTSGKTYSGYIYPMIRLASDTDDAYIPHQSQTKALYTQQPFRAIGEVKDRFVKVDGVWYEEHNINKYELTGVEHWTKHETKNNNAYYFMITNYMNDIPANTINNDFMSAILCSHFKTEVVNTFVFNDMQGAGLGTVTSAGQANFFIGTGLNGISTIEELKAWVTEQYTKGKPLTIYYALKTPILIPCTAEQVEVLEYLNKEIKSYDEQTNISSTDAISPIFDVTAYQRISEEFKTRLKEGKITRGYLKVLATDTLPELIIDENNYLKDLKIEELRYVPEEGFIGGAVAKRVTGNFNNVDNSFDIQDREVEVYLGVELEDETTEYIKYGTYIVQRPEDDQVNDNTSFEALDYMVKFNQKYKDRITYPCKLKELLNDVLDQAGVNSKVNTFANSDFIVENNQFEQGTTLRDAIKAIAQMAFNWARIDEDDNFVMDFEINEEVDEELGTDDYFSFKKSDDYGPVNVVVLRNSQVEGENVTIKDEALINSPKGYNRLKVTATSKTENGITFTVNKDGTVFGDGTATADTTLLIQPITKYDKGDYILSDEANGSGTTYFTRLYRGSSGYDTIAQTTAGTTKFSLNEDTEFRTYILIKSGATLNNVIFKPMIVRGKEEKPYQPYIPNGEVELVIADNPFAYTELKRKQLIEAGRRLFGLRYTPMTVDMLGLMYLNAKDRISVENSNGEKFNTYLLDHTIDYTGIVLDSMQSQAKTKTETKYQYISSLAQGLSQVEIKVDKANKKIESIVRTQEDVSEKVAKTVARIEVVYALSDSPTTAPTEGWSTTAPKWTAGKYMWQKTITTYANGTTAETAATNISGAKGEAGQNGIGITQTNITYQKSTSGTTVPTGTWQTTIPEVNEDGYLWTRTEFIYSDGSKKYAYNVGKKGATGIGVKSLVDQYYLSTSNTEQTGGEWTETQDAFEEGKYIWTRTKINWTDNSITYTDPVLANTLNDINSNIVVLRELSSSQIIENGKIITRIEETTKSLNNDYSTTEQVDSKINGLEDKYKTLEKRFVDIEASNKEYAIKINAIDNNGVDKVKTLMGYTFNDKGLNIDRPEADTGTIVDEAGIQVVDKTGAGDPTDILYAGYVKEDNTKYADYAGQTIVATSNLIVKNFLVIGSNSRFQDYTNPILGGQGTGVYDI